MHLRCKRGYNAYKIGEVINSYVLYRSINTSTINQTCKAGADLHASLLLISLMNLKISPEALEKFYAYTHRGREPTLWDLEGHLKLVFI